ncbi:MAG: FG-GAP repeat domain-containing protein, partial [Bacteroidota bacterium]
MKKILYQFVFPGLVAGLSLLLLGGVHSQARAQESAPRRGTSAGAEGTVTCSIQSGAGYNAVFKPYKQYDCGRGASGVGAGDFNHDGRTDVALSTTASGWTHELLIFLQDGNGVLGQPTSYAGGNRSEYLAVGDFNHDGWDDVVTADYDNTISVYLQQADGTLANRVTYPTNTGPDSIAVADVNNDTWDEIIVSHWNSSMIGVFTQKADGTLNPMVIYPSAQAGYDDIETGDVNGDGRTDVVKMNGQGYANPNLMVYLQN